MKSNGRDHFQDLEKGNDIQYAATGASCCHKDVYHLKRREVKCCYFPSNEWT